MKHHQPTDSEIRERIESIEEEEYRLLYMYQYEILGRISEVAGKYTPHRDDHKIIHVDDEPFILFIVKTAKRKGRLRPCARPLNPEYDPWAQRILDYIENSDKEHPFLLHENPSTSKTYAMNRAKQVFSPYEWPMSDYTRTFPHEYTEDMVKTRRWGDEGYEEYLVVLPDGRRAWTKSEDTVTLSEKVEPRWKPVTSHVLRKISTQSLVDNYGLSLVSVARFGGWTVTGQRQGVSASLGKHYLYLDLRESEAAVPQLEKWARRYARKLLVPYELLV